ncbi:MAG: N-formylglutamate amidohydrolase [Sphingomonadales bacterium]|nr:N-formylglutamate amidohydrolase [Sphingomonadales bacterium]
MTGAVSGTGDSLRSTGGEIPGTVGVPAFSLTAPQPSVLPIVVAVPHAGRAYPEAVLQQMRNPGFATLRLEDRYVDRLGEGIARSTGAALLVAHAPRAMIDLNRAIDDVDWGMFVRSEPSERSVSPAGLRARNGLGLIPRRIPGLGELWKRRHDETELLARIAAIHDPYHAVLAAQLSQIRMRWGAALLIDLHSMPPLGRRGSSNAPEFVVGDRFGASCDGALVASCFSYFNETARIAAHNRPYAGGYVLDRHAAPASGIYAIQLEIDRSSYLDERLAEPGPGFESMIELLTGLVRRLASEVADLGRSAGLANAAE